VGPTFALNTSYDLVIGKVVPFGVRKINFNTEIAVKISLQCALELDICMPGDKIPSPVDGKRRKNCCRDKG